MPDPCVEMIPDPLAPPRIARIVVFAINANSKYDDSSDPGGRQGRGDLLIARRIYYFLVKFGAKLPWAVVCDRDVQLL